MIVHGRLAPGLVEPGDTVTLRVHLPRKLAGVTLKLWETDDFIGRDGPEKRDPAGDVLLAQWDGSLSPGDGATPNDLDYVKFTPTATTIASADEDAFALRVLLPGGTEPVLVPFGNEHLEMRARSISLALSIEQGGSELFRTKSACIARMPTTTVSFEHHVYLKRDEDGEFKSDSDEDKREGLLALQWVTFGVKNGDGMQARLEVVGSGWIGPNGVSLDSEKPDAQPIVVRKGRKLFAYVHERKLDLPKGVSKIPTAACDEVDEDGNVIAERPEQGDLLDIRIAELSADFGERLTFATDISSLGEAGDANAEHVTSFAEAAKRFQKVT